MKKLFAIALMLVMLVGCFAGCGEQGKVITSDKDLPGATIGVQLGTTGDIFASDFEEEGSTIERFNKGADAVVALTQGKLDCVIIDNEPAMAFVAANEGLKILETEYVEEDYAICFAKENTELQEKVNAALKELIADGSVKKVVDKYIPSK